MSNNVLNSFFDELDTKITLSEDLEQIISEKFLILQLIFPDIIMDETIKRKTAINDITLFMKTDRNTMDKLINFNASYVGQDYNIQIKYNLFTFHIINTSIRAERIDKFDEEDLMRTERIFPNVKKIIRIIKYLGKIYNIYNLYELEVLIYGALQRKDNNTLSLQIYQIIEQISDIYPSSRFTHNPYGDILSDASKYAFVAANEERKNNYDDALKIWKLLFKMN